jgi:iron-sulfur cluster assembly protein
MLTITPNAAGAIENLVAASEIESGGLRIAADIPDNGTTQVGFRVEVVTEPDPADTVVEDRASSARVFVEAQAAPQLDDVTLDAQADGGQIRFVLMPAPGA